MEIHPNGIEKFSRGKIIFELRKYVTVRTAGEEDRGLSKKNECKCTGGLLETEIVNHRGMIVRIKTYFPHNEGDLRRSSRVKEKTKGGGIK